MYTVGMQVTMDVDDNQVIGIQVVHLFTQINMKVRNMKKENFV